MVQPKKPPVSLRLPGDLQAAVEQFATERGMPRNAAYVELLRRGLKVAIGAGVPRSAPAKAVAAANASIKVALANPPKVDVQLGPVPVKAASRLKVKK